MRRTSTSFLLVTSPHDSYWTKGTAKMISLYIASAIGTTHWQWNWQWRSQSPRRRWRRSRRSWMYWTLKVQMALKVLTMTRVQMNGMANKAVTQTSWHGMEWTDWFFCSFMRYNNSTACLRIQAWNVDIHHRHNLLWQNPHDDGDDTLSLAAPRIYCKCNSCVPWRWKNMNTQQSDFDGTGLSLSL